MKIQIQEACLETDKIDFEQATRFINAFNKIKSHEKEWAKGDVISLLKLFESHNVADDIVDGLSIGKGH